MSFGSTTLTATGNYDMFVAKVDPTGRWVWATRAGGTGFDAADGVAVAADGSALVAGAFSGSASFGSTTLTCAAVAFTAGFVAGVGADGVWWSRPPSGSVRVVSPADGSPVSSGAWFPVTAQTTGLPAGTTAYATVDGVAVASAGVDPRGIARFAQVPARAGMYAVRVGAAPSPVVSAPFRLAIKPFGITGHAPAPAPGAPRGRVRFTVATGNWSPGTPIRLTRNGTAIAVVPVTTTGAPVSVMVPWVAGTYQVRVRTAQGWVHGDRTGAVTLR